MNYTSLTILVYLAAVLASAISVWLAIRSRREIHNLRRGTASGPSTRLLLEVIRLRSAGLDASRIAAKLGVTPGEVRFLLDVEEDRAQRTTTLAAT